MNKVRRKNIQNAALKIEEQLDLLREYLAEEEDSFDSLSEGLQQTMRGEEMEECIEILDENIDAIDDALDNLRDI